LLAPATMRGSLSKDSVRDVGTFQRISAAVKDIQGELDGIIEKSERAKNSLLELSATEATPEEDGSLHPALQQHFNFRGDSVTVSQSSGNLRQYPTYALYGEWEKLSHFGDKPLSYLRQPVQSMLRRQDTISGLSNSLGLEAGQPRKKECRWFMLDPTSYSRLAWSFLGLLFVLFDAISIPVIVSWDVANTWLSVISVVCMVYWTLDMLSSTQTGFYESGELILSSSRALQHYLKGWFLFDCTLVTLDWVMLALDDSDAETVFVGHRFARVVRVVRTLRLVRLLKLNVLMRVLEDQLSLGYTQAVQLTSAVIKSMLIIMFAVHALGCTWYYVGRAEVESANGPNWLSSANMVLSNMEDQYLASCHWVLCQFTPAPVSIHAQNSRERVYNILVIFFSLLVMGSAISRVSASIQAAIKMNSEAQDRRRHVTQYLKLNKVSLGLQIRVLRFVDHNLSKLSAVQLDERLLSDTLKDELYMDRRGPLLRLHPMYDFMSKISPKAFTKLCGMLKLAIFEDREVIFTRLTPARGMYITAPGRYIRNAGHMDQKISSKSHTFYAEISLFVKVEHRLTLSSFQFNDVFILPYLQLADGVKELPECCGFVYQYAKAMQRQLNDGEVAATDMVPLEVASHCCQQTDAYKILNMSDDMLLHKFQVPQQTQDVSVYQWLDAFFARKSAENLASRYSLVSELCGFFPELLPNGTYEIFSNDGSAARAVSSICSLLWLVKDEHHEFVQPQRTESRMDRQTWERLQEFVAWTEVKSSLKWLYGLCVLIVVSGLSGSKHLSWQFPDSHQDPDEAVLYMLLVMHNVAPSVRGLDQDTLAVVTKVARLRKAFAFAQFVQGENTPHNIYLLQQALKDEEPIVFKLFLLAELAILFGVGASWGCTGSHFLTQNMAQMVMLGLGALKNLRPGPEVSLEIYWDYLCSWGRLLRLPEVAPQDLAFVRLARICRINARGKDLQLLYSCWSKVPPSDKAVLTDFFLADGIRHHASLLSYLPACFENARQNPAVGLPAMLELLVDLIEVTWVQMSQASELQVVVNLYDLATFTSVVRSRAVFSACLEHAKITKANAGFQLSLTSKNWARSDEHQGHELSLPSSLRKLLRRSRENSQVQEEVPLAAEETIVRDFI
ncbi:unnamed protein product, partial [Effrenium voratum]